MSKSHQYRIQLHCDKKMHAEINLFAQQRGLSQSAASRLLIDRALIQKSDETTYRLDNIDSYLEAILHASSAARILASDAAQAAGSKLSGDELRERIANLLTRYKQF
jgi:hypothetical protein